MGLTVFTKEVQLGKDWCAYIMVHRLKKPMLGFQIAIDRIDLDLIYISFGIWR